MSGSSRLDNQAPALFGQTPWQTTGPFFHYALPWRGGADLVGDSDIGARPDLLPSAHNRLTGPTTKGSTAASVIEVVGQIRDGAGAPVPDAMIEIWQADANGRFDAPAEGNAWGFPGFGRSATGEDGFFRFRTVQPGAVTDGESILAPHIAVGVQGRGLVKRLVTRIYFAGAPENLSDPILAIVPAERRQTLMAEARGVAWCFDIVLRGADETVFFEF